MASATAAEEAGQQFDRDFDCYVVNLARSPERLAAFHRNNGGCGIDFRRFEAADGNEISDVRAIEQKIIKPGTKWPSRGTIGVALSHRQLWEKSVAEQRRLVVFEDDAYVRDDFKTAFMELMARLPRWDIVLLGYNTDALLEFNVIGDFDLSGLFNLRQPKREQLIKFARLAEPVNTFRLKHVFGTCGYAVSREGAAQLARRCFPMDNRVVHFPATNRKLPVFSIDSMMNLFYQRLDAFVCLPPLVLTPNDRATSTVASLRLG
jgi:GR25 family glycosyltransferase involved in LPS biosynthesis